MPLASSPSAGCARARRATLLMAARLRLPAGMPDAEKEERAEGLIKRLGLANVCPYPTLPYPNLANVHARTPCVGRLPGPVRSAASQLAVNGQAGAHVEAL